MPPPEDKIREVSPVWVWRPPNIHTDKIDMEYKLGDAVQQELAVLRLETYGAIHQSLASGFTKAAEIIGRGKAEG